MKKWKKLGVVSALLGVIACSDNATPIKLKGGVALQLADGSPISQTASDDYNPYMVKMPDGYLVLAFGSDRSCGGCTAGTHNIFVARSVSSYNDDQKLPRFNQPAAFTVGGTPLNLAASASFAATKSGANLRLYFNNAQGVIHSADFAPQSTTNVASVTPIINSVWRKMNIIGIDEDGAGLFVRSSAGSVYWLNPTVLNLALPAMGSGGGYSALAKIATNQANANDAYIVLSNGSAVAASFGASTGSVKKMQSVFASAKVIVRSLSIAYTGKAAGDITLLSASESGNVLQDLYVLDGMTPAQIWNDLDTKPTTAAPILAAQTTGIYAWYELDGSRNDASGSGNNAFLPTTPFSGVDPSFAGTDRYGLSNAAATFNGTTHYFGNNFQAKCDEAFSVSLWLKPAQTASVRTILGYQPSPLANPGFMINQEAGGAVTVQAFFAADGANVSNTTGTGGTLTVAQWAHIAVVHDAVARVSTIYLNGSYIATSVHAGTNCAGACTCSGVSPVTGGQQWWNGTPMTIGYGYRGYFSGDLDQVAFFNRKLTTAEIQTLATQ